MENKSRFIQIPEDVIKLLDGNDSEEDAKILTYNIVFIIDTIDEEIKDGDCLIIGTNLYRNDGKFLYDEREAKIIPFAFDLDDYGCIPRNFDLRRFPLRFFSEILDHNSYVRLNDTMIDQIVNHTTFELPDKLTSYFMMGNEKYEVIGIPEDCKYPQSFALAETFPGALIIEMSKEPEYEVGSLKFAVSFVKMFVQQVKDQRIQYETDQRKQSWLPNTLYVIC